MICKPSSLDLMWKKIGLHSVLPSAIVVYFELCPLCYCVQVLTPIHLHGCVIAWCHRICIVNKNGVKSKNRMKMSKGS